MKIATPTTASSNICPGHNHTQAAKRGKHQCMAIATLEAGYWGLKKIPTQPIATIFRTRNVQRVGFVLLSCCTQPHFGCNHAFACMCCGQHPGSPGGRPCMLHAEACCWSAGWKRVWPGGQRHVRTGHVLQVSRRLRPTPTSRFGPPSKQNACGIQPCLSLRLGRRPAVHTSCARTYWRLLLCGCGP